MDTQKIDLNNAGGKKDNGKGKGHGAQFAASAGIGAAAGVGGTFAADALAGQPEDSKVELEELQDGMETPEMENGEMDPAVMEEARTATETAGHRDDPSDEPDFDVNSIRIEEVHHYTTVEYVPTEMDLEEIDVIVPITDEIAEAETPEIVLTEADAVEETAATEADNGDWEVQDLHVSTPAVNENVDVETPAEETHVSGPEIAETDPIGMPDENF